MSVVAQSKGQFSVLQNHSRGSNIKMPGRAMKGGLSTTFDGCDSELVVSERRRQDLDDCEWNVGHDWDDGE